MYKSLDAFRKITDDLLQDEKANPVAKYIPSSTLHESLDLSLQEEAMDEDSFQKLLKELVLATPRTGTRGFFNQLFGGRNDKAILGELLAVMMNNSMYTYKAAGPQIGVEKAVIREICKLIGWGNQSDGTLAPGGSMTNFMSMLMARDSAASSVRSEGLKDKMLVYTSNESHYSIPKNAAFSGIGRDNIRYVDTDDEGRIDVVKLKEMITNDIADGGWPIMVNLTAGTTVMGAFDPIPPVSELCEKYKMWLHVDGAYCGSVLFTDKYKHLIDGLEAVDSFSVNAHKMLGTPLSCSIIVCKNKKHLYDSFSNDASYLYQTDHDEFNLGKTSLQCGRRNDALKFWTLWKSVGTQGLADIVNHQFDLADIAREYVRLNPDYRLYSYDESIAICFNYKGIPAEEICTRLYEDGKLMVGYGNFKGTTFIRLVTVNAQNSKEDILNFFTTLEAFVEEHPELHSLNESHTPN
jgi:sulfinoalanine decarboxylase/sulfinoalanine decarboxylase/aspartate 1-decarboxylase